MGAITIQEAQTKLPEIIQGLRPGEGIQITADGKAVAVVTAVARTEVGDQIAGGPRKLGTQAGSVLYMSPDFDAPLEDLKEYME